MPRRQRFRAGLLVMAMFCGLGGCVANSSNPVVTVRDAVMDDTRADLVLHVENPGGRRLTVDTIDCELAHGDMGFPLAHQTWRGTLDLPAGGSNDVSLSIPFETSPIESGSTLLHLNGLLSHTDHTGFLGLRSMDLAESVFQLEVEAKRRSP